MQPDLLGSLEQQIKPFQQCGVSLIAIHAKLSKDLTNRYLKALEESNHPSLAGLEIEQKIVFNLTDAPQKWDNICAILLNRWDSPRLVSTTYYDHPIAINKRTIGSFVRNPQFILNQAGFGVRVRPSGNGYPPQLSIKHSITKSWDFVRAERFKRRESEVVLPTEDIETLYNFRWLEHSYRSLRSDILSVTEGRGCRPYLRTDVNRHEAFCLAPVKIDGEERLIFMEPVCDEITGIFINPFSKSEMEIPNSHCNEVEIEFKALLDKHGDPVVNIDENKRMAAIRRASKIVRKVLLANMHNGGITPVVWKFINSSKSERQFDALAHAARSNLDERISENLELIARHHLTL